MNLVNICPEDLLGAFALDALDEERKGVEDHLVVCPRCREEVARHREVLARLVFDRVAPPDHIWDRLVASLEETPPALRLVGYQVPQAPSPASPVSQGRQRPRRVRAWAPLAAVAAVAAAFLGAASLIPDRGPDRSEAALSRSALAAMTDPEGTTVSLASADQPGHGQVVVLPGGRGYAIFDGMRTLPEDRTYQLWALRDGKRISAGVLGNAPTLAAFDLDGAAEGFAVTEEPAGGVATTDQSPVMIGWMPA
jgi:hypothetical protein